MNYRRATTVAVVEYGGRVHCAGPDGRILVLTDTAALIWGAVDGSPTASIVSRAARATGRDAAAIDGEVRDFLEALRGAGVLVAG